MEVLSPRNQSSDEWHHYSLDESWDSRLSTPLVLKFSTDEEDQEFASYSNGDNEDSCLNNNGFRDLTIESHTPTSEPVKYERKDGQWYVQNGVDVKDTQQRKEMMTVSSPSSNSETLMNISTDTDYLKIAKKGGGHKDLLTIDPHTSSPEPVKYVKSEDGKWYTHDGVDVQETLQRKEMMTVSSQPSIANSLLDIETETDYLKVAKKGGGHKDLLTVIPHTPSPEKIMCDKKDGQWYTHDGVDIKETQQRNSFSVDPNDPVPDDTSITAAGGRPTEYLELAKKGGGHSDLLIVEDHVPSPEPQKYRKSGGEWYNQDDMVIKDGPQGTLKKHRRTSSDSATEIKAETDYLRTARRGGGHKDLLSIEAHTSSPEPVKYEKKDGHWYNHIGVDIEQTQGRKDMLTLPNSPRQSCNTENPVLDIETDTDYLKIAKKGGGHKDLLTVEPHTPTPEPVKYDKHDGEWYTHDGVDVKESQSKKDLSATINSCQSDRDVIAAGQNNSEYLHLAKKGGGHKDLLTIEPHMPTPEPMSYDRTDGQWYAHDGVDIKETQSRKDMSCMLKSIPDDLTAAGENNGEYLEVAKKGGRKDLLTVEPHTPTPVPVRHDRKDGKWYTHDGVDVKETQSKKEMVTVASSPRPLSVVDVNTDTEYLKIAKKGGGHKDLLTIESHTPTPEPTKFDKKDGQWYTHDGVDVKETQARKEMVTVCSSPRSPNSAKLFDGVTETEYLKMAKKGGGHKDLFMVEPHTPKAEPVRYEKKDGKWYTHDGTDIKDTQKRKEMVTVPNTNQHPSPSNIPGNIPSETEYLKHAKKGGGHKDLLTITPHTPSTEPVRYDKKEGQWYTHDAVNVKGTPLKKGKLNRNHRRNTSSKYEVSTNTDYLKIARKGGGHKDLLSSESHTPSPEPKRYEKKGGEWYTQDNVDGNSPKGKKGSPSFSSPRQVNTDTEYLRTARGGGGHKDLLTIEHHTPSPKPQKSERKLGDWYYHNDSVVKDSSPASSIPRKSPPDTSKGTDYLKMARKGGGHKDMLTMTSQPTSPAVPQELHRNGGSTPGSSPRHPSTKDPTDYLKIARKGGRGDPDLLSYTPIQKTVNTPRSAETSRQLCDAKNHVSPLRRSASMRYSARNAESDYLSIARKGGHHQDLLTMPENESSNFKRDQASRRSLRSFRSAAVIDHVDGPSRPKTAESRHSQPIWLGGSGPERVHTPGKRFINQSSGVAPYAYHQGSPGASKNPDKI
ncbi:uncharacterized protein LOC114962816 isoform X9 [Acropora millepora]|uniref:uncharacterized protein LOC114962816 isoform X9 n=1 Tax=Acropora millepora TaxID=45264 RepID=UPI001CF156EE|nr:uncharacterized protein LOC114962816 isoform X9 [Acropora millepora]